LLYRRLQSADSNNKLNAGHSIYTVVWTCATQAQQDYFNRKTNEDAEFDHWDTQGLHERRYTKQREIREVFIGQEKQEFCHRMIHPAGNIWIRSRGHKKFKVT
jgi:hypothetical protein